MAVENDFLAFGIGAEANVIDQADYLAADSGSGVVVNGFAAGLAQSAWLNKVWRQGSIGTALLAAYIVQQTGEAVLDNGNMATLLAQLSAAIGTLLPAFPRRSILAVSGGTALLTTDYAVGIQAAGAWSATLPLVAELWLEDELKNFSIYPGTISAPVVNSVQSHFAGPSGNQPTTVILDSDGQCAHFRYYPDTNLWTFKP
ncbi:MAG: hypothetical protein WCA63_00760 [Gallionella sp.]